MNSNKEILKWPLIIAAVVVVLRVILERAGAPEFVNNVLGVAYLHTLLIPIYIAVRLAKSDRHRPYGTLVMLVALYAVWTRIMILPTYWAGRIYEWPQNRFDGLWGPDVGPFAGFVAVPLVTAGTWIVMSIVVGSILGSVIIAVIHRK